MPKLIRVFSGCKLIPIFFQLKNKYGIFHAGKINTVFIFALDSGWTGQVDRVDRSLSTWPKKSSVISIGYHLLFSTLSSIATWEKFSGFLSG